MLNPFLRPRNRPPMEAGLSQEGLEACVDTVLEGEKRACESWKVTLSSERSFSAANG